VQLLHELIDAIYDLVGSGSEFLLHRQCELSASPSAVHGPPDHSRGTCQKLRAGRKWLLQVDEHHSIAVIDKGTGWGSAPHRVGWVLAHRSRSA
jgi:hypothetical protein